MSIVDLTHDLNETKIYINDNLSRENKKTRKKRGIKL